MKIRTSISGTARSETVAGRLAIACATKLLPLLVLTLPTAVEAQFNYTTNNGTITITGYTGPGGAVTIPDAIGGLPVTSIGSIGTNAFYLSGLTSITIPNSVTNIADSAFSGCSRLTSITIPNSVTSIGDSAFSFTSLTGVTIPDSVTSIGNGVFENCGLVSVTIPDSVKSIGTNAFANCGLSVISIGSGVTKVEDSAFYGCRSLSAVIFQGNPPWLGQHVFDGDSNAIVYYMPGTTGWDWTFGGRPTVLWDLEVQFNYTTNNDTITITTYRGPGGAVTIPDAIGGLPVTSIGTNAFYYSGLTSVTIPTSVTNIGDYAFSGCGRLSSVIIPNSVTGIGEFAFVNSNLRTVTIGDSVSSIGSGAFYSPSLTAITVVALNSFYSSVDGVLFNKSLTTLVQYPRAKAGSDYTIPNSVTAIGESAFGSSLNLTSVTIPNSVTSIRDGAFGDCLYLHIVTIGNSVTSIGGGAFYDCQSLNAVLFQGNAPRLGSDVFYYANNATVYYLPGTTGWGPTFGGRPTVLLNLQAQFAYTANNGTITITGYTGPGGAVTIPSTIKGLPVTRIGDHAFDSCGSLTDITISANVSNIGAGAFQYCERLARVTIPNRVTAIGDRAFYVCKGLTNVKIPDSVTTLGSMAFQSCWGLTNITIPNSVISIGDTAFRECYNLSHVTIGNSVTTIGDSAFEGCIYLTSIYGNGNAPMAGISVFDNDSIATVYYLPGTTGWGTTFGGRPTAPWVLPNPVILNIGPSFGVQTNGFGFVISWANHNSVVVEACTDFANPTWLPLQTNTLSGGWSYFSDPPWTNYPSRFYRLRWP